MTLDDMNREDKLTLVGLARLMVRLDHQFSQEEAGALGHLVDEFGDEQFWKLVEDSAGVEPGVLRQRAAAISDEESQELIYGSLYELAIAGSIDPGENDLLDWLEETWGLEVSDIEPDYGDGDADAPDDAN